LVSVCVIGGGTAGQGAAFEAGVRGVDVTIVDGRAIQEPPWGSWPELISGPQGSGRVPEWPWGPSPRVINEAASAAGPGFVALSSGGRVRFDLVIIATGSRFEPVAFLGARKTGVFILDGPERYAELGRTCASLGRAVVTGEGYRGVEVADRLGNRGTGVRLLISCWQCKPPSPVVLEVIEDAARESGAEIGRGGVSKVVGNDRVEAVVASGSVIPCDALVVVPPRLPSPVRSAAKLGHAGAVEVDRWMRTSVPSIFAAGGCAELKGSAGGLGTLSAEPSHSGRIAGSNCAGSGHSIGGTRIDQLRAFGLRWWRIGRRAETSAPPANGAERVSRRWGPDCACSITHEKSSERVVEMESIQPSTSSPSGLPPLDTGVTLESLALGLGLSDISPISETARLGLRDWPES